MTDDLFFARENCAFTLKYKDINAVIMVILYFIFFCLWKHYIHFKLLFNWIHQMKIFNDKSDYECIGNKSEFIMAYCI